MNDEQTGWKTPVSATENRLMNSTSDRSPRIALFHAAVSLLPQFISCPFGRLSKDEQKAVLKEAVWTSKELMKLCQYSENELTTADLKTAVAAATEEQLPGSRPEWIRMPVKNSCPYSGLKRSTLYTLVTPNESNGHKPPVRSISLRRKGAAKGIRLIHLKSLLEYLGTQTD